MNNKKKSNELKINRLYDAPLKAVWDAWTDPAQVVKWWGPRGFSLTTHSRDLKTDGHWHYTMHGPDGTDHPNKTKYLEVEPYSKLVYDHGANDVQQALFRVTVLFTEKGGKTAMEMTMRLSTPEEADQTRKFIRKAGGDATWDRLAEHLEMQNSGREIFVINRVFQAPIGLMFDMWTNPEHISKWLPPAGFVMEFKRADIREGGSSFYKMDGGEGLVTMFGNAEYIKIRKPDLIIYKQQFSDEKENISRHPLAPTWPASMLTTIVLTSEGSEETRVTVKWEVCGDVTAEELNTFINGRSGMSQGWGGSFDKLEALIN